MPTTLIAPGWRRPVIVAAAGCAVVVVALAAIVYHGRSTSFDDWVFRKFYDGIGWSTAHFLLDLSVPTTSIIILAVVVGIALWLRQWQLAALAAFGPLLAIMTTEFVFKPIVGRALHPAALNGNLPLSIRSVYPSGHETTVAATALVLSIAATRLPVRLRLRVALIAVFVAWLLASAVGLVRNYWHYPTDTVGAMCLAVTVIGCTALFIDRYGARLGPKIAKVLRVLWRVDDARADDRAAVR
jgi:undecaprenyl-diphosphatase